RPRRAPEDPPPPGRVGSTRAVIPSRSRPPPIPTRHDPHTIPLRSACRYPARACERRPAFGSGGARAGGASLAAGYRCDRTGGADGYVAVDGQGGIHVIIGGRYRFGSAPDQLGPEEPITELAPVNTVRMSVD